jgi:membrane-associated phospholipid phosphatase
VVAGGIALMVFSRQVLFATVNTHYTDIADTVMYYITCMGQVEVIIPVLLLVFFIPAYRNWWYIISALLCNLVPLLIQQMLKVYFSHPRPLFYFKHAKWIHFLHSWPELLQWSFPSGHSEGAFSFFCFLSLLLPAKYNKLGFLFFLLALSVCYSRLYLAAHFFDDVYAGSIVGTVVTTLVFAVMNKYKDHFYRKSNTFI